MSMLAEFLQKYIPFSDTKPLIEAFSASKILNKNDILIRPGQRSTFLAFINKGAFRVYFYNEKGDELTTWFSFAGMMVTDMLAFYTESPAIPM